MLIICEVVQFHTNLATSEAPEIVRRRMDGKWVNSRYQQSYFTSKPFFLFHCYQPSFSQNFPLVQNNFWLLLGGSKEPDFILQITISMNTSKKFHLNRSRHSWNIHFFQNFFFSLPEKPVFYLGFVFPGRATFFAYFKEILAGVFKLFNESFMEIFEYIGEIYIYIKKIIRYLWKFLRYYEKFRGKLLFRSFPNIFSEIFYNHFKICSKFSQSISNFSQNLVNFFFMRKMIRLIVFKNFSYLL